MKQEEKKFSNLTNYPPILINFDYNDLVKDTLAHKQTYQQMLPVKTKKRK